MQILPVLDLLGGQVVHGIAGRRQDYLPMRSPLIDSSEPLAVSRRFRAVFGLDELYVADLDAIAGQAPSLELFRNLVQDGFRLWVDAGVDRVEKALELDQAGVRTIVVGLETLPNEELLTELVRRFGPERVVFSLDLREGKALGSLFHSDDPLAICAKVIARGISRILVLDLVRVGTETGTGTETLCRQLVRDHPHIHVSARGGVRGNEDLRRLHSVGVQAALVASALHDRGITRVDLECLTLDSGRLRSI